MGMTKHVDHRPAAMAGHQIKGVHPLIHLPCAATVWERVGKTSLVQGAGQLVETTSFHTGFSE